MPVGGTANAMPCDTGSNEIPYVAFVTFGSRRLSISLDINVDEILRFG